MEQRQIISHTLLSLMLLTSGSLYSCSRQDSAPKVSTPSPSEAKINPLKTSLGEVQKQLKLVETSLDSINSGLHTFVKTKKGGRDIDFETIKSQWQNFKDKWEITKGQLDSQNEVKSKLPSLNHLEDKIKSFDTTIRLLNTDIISRNKNKILLLQKNLQIPSANLVSPGTFGSLTQQTLEIKTKSDITEIELGLLQIEKVIGQWQQIQPTKPINSPPTEKKDNPIINALLPLTIMLALGELGFIIYLLKRKKANTDTDINTYSEKESPKLSPHERDMLPVLETENKQLRSELSQSKQQIRELESEKTALIQKNSLRESSNKDIQKYQESLTVRQIDPNPKPPLDPYPIDLVFELPPTDLDKNEQKLIEDYNNNEIKGRYGELIGVSPVSNFIELSRGGEKPILTKQSPSKYWIIRDKYLVPQYSALDTSAMASVQILFDCPGYQQEVSGAKEFTLQRTGKVQKVGDSWELGEKGVLDYSK